MAHDVFISHSSKDKPTADAVCAVLESQGVRCWIAPRDIVPGKDWGASIVEAIKEARVMVLIFSGHANESQQIKLEVERAVNKGIPIIPLRIENIVPTESLELFLGLRHWLDAYTAPMAPHLNHLSGVVREIVGGAPATVLPMPASSVGEAKATAKADQQAGTSEHTGRLERLAASAPGKPAGQEAPEKPPSPAKRNWLVIGCLTSVMVLAAIWYLAVYRPGEAKKQADAREAAYAAAEQQAAAAAQAKADAAAAQTRADAAAAQAEADAAKAKEEARKQADAKAAADAAAAQQAAAAAQAKADAAAAQAPADEAAAQAKADAARAKQEADAHAALVQGTNYVNAGNYDAAAQSFGKAANIGNDVVSAAAKSGLAWVNAARDVQAALIQGTNSLIVGDYDAAIRLFGKAAHFGNAAVAASARVLIFKAKADKAKQAQPLQLASIVGEWKPDNARTLGKNIQELSKGSLLFGLGTNGELNCSGTFSSHYTLRSGLFRHRNNYSFEGTVLSCELDTKATNHASKAPVELDYVLHGQFTEDTSQYNTVKLRVLPASQPTNSVDLKVRFGDLDCDFSRLK